MKIKYLVLALLILITLINNAGCVIITVCDSGCDYTTITNAISASNSYDVIEVGQGTYNEFIDIQTNHLTLNGAGIDNTYIYQHDSCLRIIGNHINMSGFSMSTSGGMYYDIAWIRGNHLNISFNEFLIGDYGIYFGDVNDCIISNNNITSCIGNGLHFTSGHDNLIFNNYITFCNKGIIIPTNHINSIIYNNYFSNNTIHAEGGNTLTKWNITKQLGISIVNGKYLGGNFWNDYIGIDNDNDDLGDTLLPYNNNIVNGGDYHPLIKGTPTPTPHSNSTETYHTQTFDDLFEDLSVWGFLTVIFATFELQCGGDLFWLIIIMVPFTMTWIKQRSVIIPSILALVCGSVLFTMVPESAIAPIKILLTVGIAGIFYHIIKSR